MVLVDGVKFACQSCIKGHRSTKVSQNECEYRFECTDRVNACTHTSRPLVEIKKKGRPTSQCSHCRDLRKTRSVHGKCDCAGKELEEKPIKAVLPNGLSDIIKKRDEDGDPIASSSKVKGGVRVSQLLNPCNCRRGGKCNCCTVVDRSKKSRMSFDSTASSSSAAPSPIPSTSRSRSVSRNRTGSRSSGCCGSKAATATTPATTMSTNGSSPVVATPSSTTSSDAFSPPSTSGFFFNNTSEMPSFPTPPSQHLHQSNLQQHQQQQQQPSQQQQLPFASTSYLPMAPTPLSQAFSPAAFSFPHQSVQSPSSIFGPATQLGGCIGDDPTCTLLLAHLQATAPPPTDPKGFGNLVSNSKPWSNSPFAQSFIPHQTPLFLPHTQGTSACFCGDSCTCVGCPQHDPLGQKRSPSHEAGPGCGCRNRAAESAVPPLNMPSDLDQSRINATIALTQQLQPSGKRVCCRTNSGAQVPSAVSSIDQLLQSVMDSASPCAITGSNQCAMSLPGLWNESGNEVIAANLPSVNDVWSGQAMSSNDPWFGSMTNNLFNSDAPQALPLFIAPEQRQKRKAKAQSVWALEPLPESMDPWELTPNSTNAPTVSNSTSTTDFFSSDFLSSSTALRSNEANGCSGMYAPSLEDPLGLGERSTTLSVDGGEAEDLEPGCGDACQCSATCACRMQIDVDDQDQEDEDDDSDEPVSTLAGSTPMSRNVSQDSPFTVTAPKVEEDGGVPTSQMAATSIGGNPDAINHVGGESQAPSTNSGSRAEADDPFNFEGFTAEDIEGVFGTTSGINSPLVDGSPVQTNQSSSQSLPPGFNPRSPLGMSDFIAAGFC